MADSLTATLRANLDQLRGDFDKAVGAAGDAVSRIEQQFRQINPTAALNNIDGKPLSLVSDAAIAATAAVGGMLANLVRLAGSLADIGDRSDDLRLPIDLLQGLGFAADEARVKGDKLNSALDHFSDISKKTTDDAANFYKALDNIGASFGMAFQQAPSQADRLKVVSNALSSTTNEVKRAQLAQEAFGTDNERLIGIFDKGGSAIDGYIQRVRDLGLQIDENFVRDAQNAQGQLRLLADVIDKQLAVSVRDLLPLLKEVGPIVQSLAYLAGRTFSVFAQDANKPSSALQAEIETLTNEQNELIALRDRAANNTPSTSDKARLWLQKQLGIAPDDIADYNKQIEYLQKQIDSRNKIITDRSSPNSSGDKPAFKPRPGLGDGKDNSPDAFDRQTDSINRHIAALNADAAAVGKTASEMEQMRAEAQLLQAVQRDDGEVTQEQIDKYTALRASMTAQQALTAAGITLNQEHAQTFADVSARMGLAAQALDDYKRHWQGIQSAVQFGGNEIIDIMDGLRNKTLTASDAVRQLANSFIHAAEQALLLGQGPLAGILGMSPTAVGGTGGGLGAILDLFKGSGAASAGGFYSPAAGLPAIGHAATGGSFDAGDWSMVGERGPELVRFGTNATVLPNNKSFGNQQPARLVVNNYAGGMVEADARQNEDGELEVTVRGIVRDEMAGPRTNTITRTKYGQEPLLRRRA